MINETREPHTPDKSSVRCDEPIQVHTFWVILSIYNAKYLMVRKFDKQKGGIKDASYFYDKSKIWPVFGTIPVPDHSRE